MRKNSHDTTDSPKGTYYFDVPCVGLRPVTHTFIQSYIRKGAYNTDSNYLGYYIANDNVRICIRNLADIRIVGGDTKVTVKWH